MKRVNRTGIRLEAIGAGEYAGFELDGDGRFLLGDFTVTHNTSTALQVCWGLSPANITATTSSLRGSAATLRYSEAFPPLQRLRSVSRVLVVCPPHLVQNWIDECKACLPAVRVVELRTVSDVDAMSSLPGDFVVGVMSREAAKLGHGVEGVGVPKCPRCGTRHGVSADKLASSRATCQGQMVEPLDAMARVAWDMHQLRQRGAKWNADAFATLRRQAAVTLLRRLKNTTTRLKETWRSKRVQLGWDDQKAVIETLKLVTADPRVLRCLRLSKVGGHSNYLLADFAHKLDDATLCKTLADLGKWRRRDCGEPLYQAVPTPRRYPLAEYVCRRHPTLFQMLVVDEFHEYASDGSAQGQAIHRLTEKIRYVLPLTGSLMNGYAKSLFRNLWAVSRRRMREEFDHGDAAKFAKLYGYQKRILTGDAARESRVTERGSSSDRVIKTEGGERTQDAPGVLPSFVLRHVLPLSVTLHKRDINPDDRVVDHDRVELAWGWGGRDEDAELDGVVTSNGQHLGSKLVGAVKRDRFDEKLAGKLFGQMAELPSYYDRASADTGNSGVPTERSYVIAYPEDVGGDVVASAKGVDASALLAKERWLVATLRRELAEGRRCLVFLWHKDLAPRLVRVVAVATGEQPAFLDAEKVPARKRQEWIDKNVVGKRKVLITNPSCVQTGLNNLIWFSTAVFFENPGCNPFVARQAVGRLDRITQREEVRVFWPVYEGVQAKVLDLLQTKSAISQQIDGIDPTAALEMAGGGESEVESMDVGMAIYRYLGGD